MKRRSLRLMRKLLTFVTDYLLFLAAFVFTALSAPLTYAWLILDVPLEIVSTMLVRYWVSALLCLWGGVMWHIVERDP